MFFCISVELWYK